MSPLQRMLAATCSPSTVDDMRRETNRWRIRCTTCGHAKPLWEAGGVRWRKRSLGSLSATLIRCEGCGRLRIGVVERVPDDSTVSS